MVWGWGLRGSSGWGWGLNVVTWFGGGAWWEHRDWWVRPKGGGSRGLGAGLDGALGLGRGV